MTRNDLTRRGVLGATLATAGATIARAQGTAMTPPAAPVTLNIVDVAGSLQLTQAAFENYRRAKPAVVSRIGFTQAPAPEIPGKLKAQQDAGRVDIDLVLSGNDALAAGIEQKLWAPLLTQYADRLPKLADILSPPALKLQAAAAGQAVIVAPLPRRPDPRIHARQGRPSARHRRRADGLVPRQPAPLHVRPSGQLRPRPRLHDGPALHPRRHRPARSGARWDKTWAYLAEMSAFIEYYPTGTAAVFKELGEGSRDMVASHVGWDLNPRILGIVPKEARIATLAGFHWIGDAHFMCVPRGLSSEKMAVVCDLISFMLLPAQQALTYDRGYFYPGPAVKDVPLSMAPQASQDAIGEFGRPEYAKLIADTPMELPLDADKLVYAFKRWDQQVGAKVGK